MKQLNPLKNKWTAWALWFLWAVLVLKFSSDTGQTSSGKSGWILTHVLSVLYVFGIEVNHVDLMHTLIRKAAHMFNYLCMGLIGYNALRLTFNWSLNRKLMGAFAITAMFACLDEFFQTFVPGRTGQVKDVLIDASGTFLGLLGLWLWVSYKKGIKK